MSEESMAARQRARLAFTTLITGDEASIDLARAALLIAAEEYPALDINEYLLRLDDLAEQVREHMRSQALAVASTPATTDECLDILRAMNSVLFGRERFRGSRVDYYNPQNSFLNRVLERRLGIPLTLSLIYMEVGKRLGMLVEGVGMPFHFIVRCTLPESFIYVDPYEKGKFLNEQDCRQRLVRIFKNQEDLDARWLEPLGPKQFLVRMLDNLKHIYIHKGDYERALMACDRILLLNPEQASERRDRGIVHFHLKHYARAVRDLGTYLELSPQADDAEEIRQQIRVIRQLIAMMN
ncbi:MAG TPA: transglutaminase-like domain-containing protein [Ktedonobacteraceae bacterium]|nr:transglutaminase-like domain-containing protein [Ktedonobacteraceae bacterium]HLI68881.1 transglutaminase-like domain-containing protein [Ktedonobacteraceae bacterium]